MKRSMMIAFHQLAAWTKNYRVWAAFLLSFGFCLITTSRYISFASVIGTPIHVAEAYMIIGSSTSYYAGILLGGLLLLSDAPFTSSRSIYEILRVGRKSWFGGQVLYVALSVTVYTVITSLFSLIIAYLSGKAYLADSWSDTMYLLVNRPPQIALFEFRLAFPYPSLLTELTPYSTFLRTLLFNGCYCFLLCLCLFSVNAWLENHIGWLVSILIHIVGYIITANGLMTRQFQRFSPLSCAFFVNQYDENTGITALSAITLFGLLYSLLIALAYRKGQTMTG